MALPRTVGIGLKSSHVEAVVAGGHALGFVEIHAENAMGAGGPVHARLGAVRALLPLSVHGVGLSLGGATAPDAAHLQRLARVVERFEATCVSEHLAWSTHAGVFFNDLLPIGYDDASLQRVLDHVQCVQERLRQPLLIENPAVCLRLSTGVFEEADFLAELAYRSGCGLLLDLNNLAVSAANQGQCPHAVLARFPLQAVQQIHLAGHAVEALADGSELRIDDHGSVVSAEVWALYAAVLARCGPLPTLIEWDTRVPTFETLLAQAQHARLLQLRPRQAA
ncbi:DUF692 family multinuclear iron-containing protein [Aquimonas sp.]|jgi:uncharacterized protein (UPF0276 family)|uniref:MNIO family bufferin maturase n=1 Tax=Aquimonas sp. TaxID=1872588 RepID=UPI0037BF6894